MFGRVVSGSLPLVVDVQNKVSSVIFRDYVLLILQYDIAQLIKIKHDFPSINLILYGAAEATAVQNLICLFCRR